MEAPVRQNEVADVAAGTLSGQIRFSVLNFNKERGWFGLGSGRSWERKLCDSQRSGAEKSDHYTLVISYAEHVPQSPIRLNAAGQAEAAVPKVSPFCSWQKPLPPQSSDQFHFCFRLFVGKT
jgi:hypothetical protein